MAKSKSLLDSFLFQNAKKAVDLLSKDEEIEGGAISDQDKSSIISGSDQDRITKGAPKEQIHITSLSDKEQIHVTKGAPKEHDGITTKKIKKDITKGAVSISLSKSQTAVYLWFLDRGETGVFNKPEIQHALSMPYITVRKAINKLEMLGIIELYYDGCQKIYEYKINKNSQLKLAENTNITSGSYQDRSRIISDPLSSSNNITTAKNSDFKKDLLDDPELGYWRQKGLKEKQITDWIEVAGCSYDSMIQYLCYCRFEMVDNNLESTKPVKNVFNWFFKIIEKTGSYPKPKGYKSFKEKQLEKDRLIVEQKEKEAEEAKELYRRKFEAERDKEFWKMMNDEDGDIFKDCFERLNGFQKNTKKGKVFEISMRKAFDDFMADDEVEGSEARI